MTKEKENVAEEVATETTQTPATSAAETAAEEVAEDLPATVDNENLSIELEGLADFENSIAGMLAQAEKLSVKTKKISLTSKYLEFQTLGQKFRGIFAGFTEILATDKATGELKKIKAARFIGQDKSLFVNGGVALVNELLKSGVPIGASLEVTFSEKKGNAKIYTLDLLG